MNAEKFNDFRIVKWKTRKKMSSFQVQLSRVPVGFRGNFTPAPGARSKRICPFLVAEEIDENETRRSRVAFSERYVVCTCVRFRWPRAIIVDRIGARDRGRVSENFGFRVNGLTKYPVTSHWVRRRASLRLCIFIYI